MKKIILNKNNSKKLIIGISILFCTIILIIGGTLAFFTQSDSKKMEDLLTTDIRDTLKYNDNKEYMRYGLIPAKVDIAKQAYEIEGDNKCLDSYGYSACSIYQFSIKNIAKVSQELMIDMAPIINNFGNLHFMLYEIDKEGNNNEIISSKKLDTLTDEIIQNNNLPSYNLVKGVSLNPNSDKTYEVVFFVNDIGEDQTSIDSGKRFGATIKISSITTGKYMVESFGEDCWQTELLSDGTYKLTEFYGIDNNLTIINENDETIDNPNYGVINELCTGYINDNDEDGYYSVYIPSKIGNQQITILGNNLLNARDKFDENEWELTSVNNYAKINNIKVEEGIEIIEDGYDWNEENEVVDLVGTFAAIGIDSDTLEPDVNTNILVDLPNTLKILGSMSFANSNVTSLSIPSSVEKISGFVFDYTDVLTELTFEGAVEGTSKLNTIESNAFYGQQLTKLIVPSSVVSFDGFGYNQQLSEVIFLTDKNGETNIKFLGGLDGTNITSITIPQGVEVIGGLSYTKLTSIKIPSSVEKINDYAFSDNSNLTTLTFEENSNLTTIGNSAFSSNNISSLTIPNSVTTIGFSAFNRNSNLTTLTFEESKDNSKELIIENMAFANNNIKTLKIPSRVKTIREDVFNSSNIENLIISPGVQIIENYAFKSKNILSLTFEENSNLTTIGVEAFYGNNISSLTIPNSVTTIGNSAFSSNSNLTTLTFEENSNLTTIGNSAFSRNNISSLTIPNSVTTIGNEAFSYNENLTTLTFEENSNLKTIEQFAFYTCSLDYQNYDSPLYLPNNEFEVMGFYAFGDNPNLKYIYYEGDTTGFGHAWNGNATLLPRRN